MRLSSLARKIRITPRNLSSFLEENQVPLEKGANTKLDEETINLVLEHFKVSLEDPKEEVPEKEEVEIQEEALEESTTVETKDNITVDPTEVKVEVEEIKSPELETIVSETPETDHEVVKVDEVEAEIEEKTPSEITQDESEESEELTEVDNEVIEFSEEPVDKKSDSTSKEYEPIETPDGTLIEARAELAALDESVDIIKAPKPAPLQGLTIKGKIELPEPKAPKPKQEASEKPLDPNEIIYTSGPKRETRKKNYKSKNGRKPKNVNTVEQERKRKARQVQKEKERKERLEKENKTAYYEQKVKSPPKQKTIKKKPKKKIKAQNEPKFEGNALQRFWHWLNT